MLTIILLTHNSLNLLEDFWSSVAPLKAQVIFHDMGSSDGTVEYLKSKGATSVVSDETSLGARKRDLVNQAKGEWILILDDDERVSDELTGEIRTLVKKSWGKIDPIAYRIRYQNHVFGKPVFWGGEKYSKVRLFRKGYGTVSNSPIHEEIVTKGKVGELQGMILHYSYRSCVQLFSKFSRYAVTMAGKMYTSGEQITPRKLVFYGPHMVWARYIKDKGYKDGLHGFVLAVAFGYMETLTYWVLVWYMLVRQKKVKSHE